MSYNLEMEEIRNSSHFAKDKNYFEWWYFHFVSRDTTANIVLHETDIFGLSRSPYVSLTLLRKGKEPKYFKKQLSIPSITREGRFLKTMGGEFSETNKELKFNLNFDGCEFKGIIEKSLPKTIVKKGILYEDEERKRKSLWLVGVPHGLFRAKINLLGEETRMNGASYHDHQWGGLKIQDFVDQWAWGHLSNDHTSLVFFHILTQRGEVLNRVIIGNKKNVKTSTSLSTDCLRYFRKNKKFYKKDYTLAINLSDKSIELNGSIKPSMLMRSRINEKYDGFDATYLRWASESNVLVNDKQEKLTGLIEYLEINKNE